MSLVQRVHHFAAQLNESFLEFIFDCIERPHIRDDYDQIPYSLVSVVLSFNQHFKGKILSLTYVLLYIFPLGKVM